MTPQRIRQGQNRKSCPGNPLTVHYFPLTICQTIFDSTAYLHKVLPAKELRSTNGTFLIFQDLFKGTQVRPDGSHPHFGEPLQWTGEVGTLVAIQTCIASPGWSCAERYRCEESEFVSGNKVARRLGRETRISHRHGWCFVSWQSTDSRCGSIY